MRRLLLGLASLALTTHLARAQEKMRVGLLGGVNHNNSRLTGPGPATYEHDPVIGPAIGVLLDIPFGRWAVQPAFQYARKGLSVAITETSTTTSNGSRYTTTEEFDIIQAWNYLEVPINVVFTTGGRRGFQLFGGPYFALLLGARQSGSYTEERTGPGYRYQSGYSLAGAVLPRNDISAQDLQRRSVDDYMRPWDAGLQVGIGYQFGGFGLRLSHAWGLRELEPKVLGEASEYQRRSRTLTLGFCYLFGQR